MNLQSNYRKIASEYFQKELLPDEVVHHIDGNHDNNKPDNLVIMKKSQHSKVHAVFNFENWRKTHHGNTCTFCMFYIMYQKYDKYEGDNKKRVLLILYELLEIMSNRLIKNEQTVDLTFTAIKQWKDKTKHDCYTGEHMGATYDLS